MATVKELNLLVRYDLNDMGSLTYSKYDMIDAINSVLRTLNGVFRKLKSDLVERETPLTLVEGNVGLPSDYQAIIEVFNSTGKPLLPFTYKQELNEHGYRISGNRLYAAGNSVNLVYRASFVPVASDDDILPLPDAFLELLRKFVLLKLQKTDMDTLTQMIVEDVQSLIPSRKYSHYRRPMPFMV